jgi:maltooligosyltrehalose trehalohydrolase
MTAYLLLAPGIPLLFQGQEFSAETPFLFFADHPGELGRLVKQGRGKFLAQFASLASPEMQARLDDPGDPRTFQRCVLDHSERDRHPEAVALHRDLIALRREVFADFSRQIDGATLGDNAWLLRYFVKDGRDLLLVVNFGCDQVLESVPEPLLAPIDDRPWRLKWSSEDSAYGGAGIPDPVVKGVWRIPGHAVVVLAPT